MNGQAGAKRLTILGGGLAGSEAAWQAAERGIDVVLAEMRPEKTTGAHRGGDLAELVCSNSLGSDLTDRAGGLLKCELERMGSLLLGCARESSVPAGSALAVDREMFARRVTEKILAHPRIELVRQEAVALPEGPAIIATGPLTSPAFSAALRALTGTGHLYFFDAIAPIVTADSIDRGKAFSDSRNNRTGDYLNCPLTRDEYQRLVRELTQAGTIPLRDFEQEIPEGVRAGAGRFFEGCLPVEELARRGLETLAYGTMRPVGLTDPRTGEKPHAVLQLRQENAAQSLYNLVGFQTNLREAEQARVFRLIPGLERAEFVRFGQMHRNTFLNAPRLLLPTFQFRGRADLFFAGQLTGVEGYVGNIATGLLAGWNAARRLQGQALLMPPLETLTGALCHYVTHAEQAHFQPMKANLGLLPPLEKKRMSKWERSRRLTERAREAFEEWWREASQS
ncbi:MAG: methylenetetrahydrofolate--tRNA-(uracil(54)-C(5))-methyltransferase (FADH(2)-oxidizing) TrmFO [Anaerolineales bacterium]